MDQENTRTVDLGAELSPQQIEVRIKHEFKPEIKYYLDEGGDNVILGREALEELFLDGDKKMVARFLKKKGLSERHALLGLNEDRTMVGITCLSKTNPVLIYRASGKYPSDKPEYLESTSDSEESKDGEYLKIISVDENAHLVAGDVFSAGGVRCKIIKNGATWSMEVTDFVD